jgi:hypothetical protein
MRKLVLGLLLTSALVVFSEAASAKSKPTGDKVGDVCQKMVNKYNWVWAEDGKSCYNPKNSQANHKK